MALTFTAVRSLPDDVDVVVVAHFTGAEAPVAEAFLAARGVDGSRDQVTVVPREGGGQWVVVGLGAPTALTPAVLRDAAGAVARTVNRAARVGVEVLIDLPDDLPAHVAAQAWAEGSVLGAYTFDRYRSDVAAAVVQEQFVAGSASKRQQEALERGARVAEGVRLARDLVNEPGGSLTPEAFAQVAVEVAEREDLSIAVLGPDDLRERGMGGVLGVNRGSEQEARFVELGYDPPGKPRGVVALVGKGITFDSGGLSIKPATAMMTMKNDMGGAAAVLGAFAAIRAVAPRCAVRGYLPLTDNMTGGDATRPGDVLRAMDGTTIEVLNTDAEGRLILADALVMASRAEPRPDAIIDLATLTGAVIVALGPKVAGLMGNHDGWIGQVEAAADRAGEAVWHLPLPAAYHRQIESDVADLRNIPKDGNAGSLAAGLFLQDFVGRGIPWAHLDIAGTAWTEATEGAITRGGTGYGVRTLLELLAGFSRPR